MKEHFAGLDGLRGLAAVAVMLMHEIGIFRPGLGPAIHAEIAVDLFYMLSGFVLAYAYDRRLDGGLGWTEFMTFRLVRLYPMLFLAIGLSATVALLKFLVQDVVDPGEALWLVPAGLFLLPTGLANGVTGPFSSRFDLIPFGGPAWSLLFELIASAVFATRIRRSGRTGLALFIACSLTLCVVTFAAGRTGSLGTQGYIGVPAGLLRVAVPFAIGMFLFRRRIFDALPQVPTVIAILTGGLLCALPIHGTPTFDLLCIFVIFPLVISFGAQPIHAKWLGTSCRVIGALSYPVYLLHVPVSRIVGFVAKAVSPVIEPNILIVLSMVGTIAASFIALYLFDQPLRTWLTRQIKKRFQRAPLSATNTEICAGHSK